MALIIPAIRALESEGVPVLTIVERVNEALGELKAFDKYTKVTKRDVLDCLRNPECLVKPYAKSAPEEASMKVNGTATRSIR